VDVSQYSIFTWLLIALIIAVFLFAGWYFYFSKRKSFLKNRRKPIIRPKREYTDEEIAFSVFLIGDMGALVPGAKDPLLEMLQSQLNKLGEKSAISFLGDNVYPYGIPHPEHRGRNRAEERLKIQLDLIKNYPGRAVMIGGNHDWNKGREGGYQYILNQEKFVEEYLGRNDIFLPKGGCPDTNVFQLNPKLALVVINTQWYVQSGERPIGSKYGCKAVTIEDSFKQIEKALAENKDKHIIIAAHQPLYSYALHGGKFKMKHHIFPLRALHKKLYFPMPLLGSVYPLYRKWFGAKEDISHPVYKKMKKRLLQIFQPYQGLIYAAGHDHNLQHIIRHNNHYIISGSGSKLGYVKGGKHAAFVAAKRGYFRVNLTNKNELWLDAWIVEKGGDAGYLSYSRKLK
jgi:predicted MPP superfamily phosphohydrolase